MIHTNRSKIVSNFYCPRFRFLHYHLGGKGIQKTASGLPALMGGCFHDAMRDIALGDSTDKAIETHVGKLQQELKAATETQPFFETIIKEQSYLLEGTVRAVVRCRMPEINRDFDLLHVEQEMPWEIAPGMVLDLRFDRVEREKSTGQVVIRDWKMTTDGGFSWVRKFERDPQVFCYVLGAKEMFPDYDITGLAIEGIARGRKKLETGKQQLFPGLRIQQTAFCYGYLHDSGKIVPKFQQGQAWTRIPLWEHLPAKDWIEDHLTLEEVKGLFLSSVPPICPTDDRLADWKEQTVFQESQLHGWAESIQLMDSKECSTRKGMNLAFPKNSENCYKYGMDYPCSMLDVCWNGEVAEDPIGSGLYEERKSHHEGDDE